MESTAFAHRVREVIAAPLADLHHRIDDTVLLFQSADLSTCCVEVLRAVQQVGDKVDQLAQDERIRDSRRRGNKDSGNDNGQPNGEQDSERNPGTSLIDTVKDWLTDKLDNPFDEIKELPGPLDMGNVTWGQLTPLIVAWGLQKMLGKIWDIMKPDYTAKTGDIIAAEKRAKKALESLADSMAKCCESMQDGLESLSKGQRVIESNIARSTSRLSSLIVTQGNLMSDQMLKSTSDLSGKMDKLSEDLVQRSPSNSVPQSVDEALEEGFIEQTKQHNRTRARMDMLGRHLGRVMLDDSGRNSILQQTVDDIRQNTQLMLERQNNVESYMQAVWGLLQRT